MESSASIVRCIEAFVQRAATTKRQAVSSFPIPSCVSTVDSTFAQVCSDADQMKVLAQHVGISPELSYEELQNIEGAADLLLDLDGQLKSPSIAIALLKALILNISLDDEPSSSGSYELAKSRKFERVIALVDLSIFGYKEEQKMRFCKLFAGSGVKYFISLLPYSKEEEAEYNFASGLIDF